MLKFFFWGILFCPLSLQLLAGPALPPLVPTGENLTDFPDWIIDKKTTYYSVDFSPNGKLLATASNSGSGGGIKLWSVHDRRLLHTFKRHSNPVYSVSFSPDSKILASGGWDKKIELWDIQARQSTPIATIEGHSDPIQSVVFSPDGKTLASGSGDNTIRLWNKKNRSLSLLHTFEGHSDIIRSVAFSPDGKTLASGSGDNTIRLWNTKTGQLLHAFEGHTAEVYTVNFSPDGKTLVSGSQDETVKLWDIQTKRLLHTFVGHSSTVSSVNFSPDGKILVSASWGKTLKLWDVQAKRLLHTLEGHSYTIYSVNFSPDGNTFASVGYDSAFKIWDIHTGHLLHSFDGHSSSVSSISFNPDSKIFAAGSGDRFLKLWDTQTKQLIHTFDHSYSVNSIDFNSAEKTLVSGSSDGKIRLWDTQTKQLLYTFNDIGRISSVSFSPNGKTIAASSYHTNTIRLWDTETKDLLHTFKEQAKSVLPISKEPSKAAQTVKSVSFSPDGNTLAAGSWDNTVKLWDTQTGQLLHTFDGHTDRINTVNFSSDGSTLASGSWDSTVKLWNTQTKSLLHTFKSHKNHVSSVRFSPDGKTLASGSNDRTIKLWDVNTKQLLPNFPANHSYPVSSVSFSPDDKTLISGSTDGTVKQWDINTGELLHTYIGGTNGNWLSHDEKRFLRGDDGSFLLIKQEQGQDLIPAPPKNALGRLEIHHTQPVPPDMITGRSNKLTLEAKNVSSQPLYWPTVQLAEDDDFSLYNIQAPQSIAPGDTQTIQFEVSPHIGKTIEPHKDSLRFRVVAPGQTSSDWLGTTVTINAPKLILRETSLLRDQHLIRVRIENIGTQTIRNLRLDLKVPSLSGKLPVQSIPNGIQAGGFIERSFLIPKSDKPPENLKTSLDIRTTGLPFMNWTFGDPEPALPDSRPLWWMYAVSALLFILIIFSIFYFRRYRHPLLLSLSEQPQRLLELPAEQLPEAQQRLRQTKRLNSVLSDAAVSEPTLQKAVDFQKWGDEKKAEYLALRLGTTLERGNGISLKTPPRFPLNIDKLQLCIPTGIAPEDLLRQLKANPATSNNITLIIGPDSNYQRKLYNTTRDLSNKWVAPQGKELTKLLLSPDPENTLAEILAGQLSLQQISPYKTGGGVHNESTFFGRRELIAQITNRDPGNYLIVGGRQLGKSTLLQALDRRYADNPQVECHYTSLSNEILIPRLTSALKLEKTDDPEIFTEQLEARIRQNNRRYIFLIDEADKFIEHEKERGYTILNVFRRLSEQGNCTFILTGFWQLYQHAVLDYQSPIRNFGEPLAVGELEKPACLELVTVPMKRMNLYWNDKTLVEELVEQCGQRANLIAIACQHIVRNLPPQQRSITAGDMHQALHSDEMRRALAGWVVGVSDEEQTYERLVVYATIERGYFTTADLLEMAQQQELQLDTQQLEKTLSRLELAFVLGRSNGRWFYRVPLFVDYIKEDAPTAKLATELQRLKPT